ncbi:hypothetical protein HELRODRAFT_81102, partial [Helobdella robusta]|uniref:glycylpeptide N-tetradecanoyltransferase n=1 Tax=Helobdella robusta TaxID=6412 RepID=T1G492_HELRO
GEDGSLLKKKSKKKKKGKDANAIHKSSEESDGPILDCESKVINNSLNTNQMDPVCKAVDLLKISHATPKSIDEAKKKHYQFWDTQPVPKFDEKIEEHGPIDVEKTIDEIRKEPYSLPAGFVWDNVDINNPVVLKEVYTLLNENYVEDDDNMFRFDYSPDFLHWALQPPGWKPEWHIGVRVQKSSKLIGFISAIPAHIRVYHHKQLMVEINFLCVHKKLRAKRVAPVLIREVTRRVNCFGIFQAVYTAGVVLPKPVSSCRFLLLLFIIAYFSALRFCSGADLMYYLRPQF